MQKHQNTVAGTNMQSNLTCVVNVGKTEQHLLHPLLYPWYTGTFVNWLVKNIPISTNFVLL